MTNSNGSANFRTGIVYVNATEVAEALDYRPSDTLIQANSTRQESMTSL